MLSQLSGEVLRSRARRSAMSGETERFRATAQRQSDARRPAAWQARPGYVERRQHVLAQDFARCVGRRLESRSVFISDNPPGSRRRRHPAHTGSDAPVSRYVNRVDAFPVALERVKSEARQVHVLWAGGGIQSVEQAADARRAWRRCLDDLRSRRDVAGPCAGSARSWVNCNARHYKPQGRSGSCRRAIRIRKKVSI